MASQDEDNDARFNHVKELTKNTFAIGQMKSSLKGLADEFQSNLNFVNKLTEVFQKSEQIQLQSLAAGTTYQQFQIKNTKALENNIVSRQEMVSFLVGGFSRGLRNLNRSTVDLADDMHLTGQNRVSYQSQL